MPRNTKDKSLRIIPQALFAAVRPTWSAWRQLFGIFAQKERRCGPPQDTDSKGCISGVPEKSMEDFQVVDNCLLVKLPEEVDHHKAGYICEKADWFILKQNVEHVVFDFEDTRFMDSSGVGIIMGRYKKISCLGGKVYILHADRQVRRILRLSGMDKIVEVMEE